MKNKFKIGIMIIVIIAVIGGGVAVIQILQASALALNLARQKTMYMAYQYAQFWDAKIDGYIKTVQSVSSVMNSYETLPLETRRRLYEDTMESVFEDMPEFVRLFTVWEPNAVDGMDARFIGRAGSTGTGQFAFALTRENGQVEKQSYDAVQATVQAAMEYLSGPNAKTVEITDPTVIKLTGSDAWCLKIMVPILNKRLNKPVGVVGCLIDIDLFQPLVERAIRDNEEIYSMAIYTNTGFILANYMPDMIGKRLTDVETQYGEYLDMVAGAVENARECELSSYDPDLQINMIMSIVPIPLAGTSTTWSLMIGSGESYILRDVNAMKRFVVFLLVIAIMGASVLVYLVLNRADKPNV